MRVVVNANILVAALLKSATTRQILLMSGLEFCAPEHLFVEVKGFVKDQRFRRRLGLSEEDLREVLAYILQPVTFFPEKMYLSFIRRAIPLVTHKEDAPYIARSLALGASLWSNDAALKKQSLVTGFTTSELVQFLARKRGRSDDHG